MGRDAFLETATVDGVLGRGATAVKTISPLPCVLAVNAGSSSIRFAVYAVGASTPSHTGRIERIGRRGTALTVAHSLGRSPKPVRVVGAGHRTAVEFLLHWLERQPFFTAIKAVGHRVVHGMKHHAPERITKALLAKLHRIMPYDPAHLPREIALIAAFRRRHPKLPQVACFDTAFHRTMPRVATLLAIPRRYQREGVERYGFHGLSYAYLLGELTRLGDPAAKTGRVILAHLGNGASLAALRHGRCIDTSMGFTPAAGLMMGTRAGDLDPGLLSYLSRSEGMTPVRFERMVNHESGLLGVSGISSDMRDLCARADTDVRAADAVNLFCYQAKKWIGAYAAALGGLDALVFAGGIGENSPLVRARICAGLGFLGVELNARDNARSAPVISKRATRVTVRVIRTNEELMIARSVVEVLGRAKSRKART